MRRKRTRKVIKRGRKITKGGGKGKGKKLGFDNTNDDDGNHVQITKGKMKFTFYFGKKRDEYLDKITKMGKKKMEFILRTECWKNIPTIEIEEFKANTGMDVIKKIKFNDRIIAIYIAHVRRMNKACGNCGRAQYCYCCNKEKGCVNLKRCEGCLITYYCNEKCQKEDWGKRHKHWCCKKDAKFSLMFKGLGAKYDNETKTFKITQLKSV